MTALSSQDYFWLDAAAACARPFLGTTAENPTVGAIIVDEAAGVERARAVTAVGGRPHAETRAIGMAGSAAAGATLYVTLEPCSHWGRTPPCVEAIIAARIARVIIGMSDPDPRVAGQGIERLSRSGIEIAVADHRPSRKLHEGFVSRITRKRPFVTAKLAVSADGMIGRPFEPNVTITGEAARQYTHCERATSDAILIGGATAIIDDPRLSVRLAGFADRQPLRIILAGSEPLPPSLTLFDKTSGQETVVIGINEKKSPSDVTFWAASGTTRPDLGAVLHLLGEKGIGRLLVESGTALTGALLAQKLVDRFLLLASPKSVGPDGQAATTGKPLAQCIADGGLEAVDQRELGADKLTVFERNA